jgi:SAM-dependent methyltransferase
LTEKRRARVENMSNVPSHDPSPPQDDSSALLPEILGWDIVNWSQALAFWSRRARLARAASALELGCGGRNSSLTLWLAKRGDAVVCSDHGGVLESIKASHRRHAIADRVTYADVDARAIPYKDRFDVIAFKSMLGGIVREDPAALSREVMRNVYDALKPGGALLFAENLRATGLHHFARSYCTGRGGTWHYFSLAEIEAMLSCFSSFEITTFGFLGCFGRSEAQRRFLGKVDRSFLDKLVPARWHYVAAAIAYK